MSTGLSSAMMLLFFLNPAMPPGESIQDAAPGPGLRLSLAGEWRWKSAKLSPANAFSAGIDDTNWEILKVPSNWWLDGRDMSGDVWLRKSFRTPSASGGKFAQLWFEGVDYAADVWLNESYLGFHEGYFQPFHFDVSHLLHTSTLNILTVRVASPVEEQGREWSLHKRLIKGIFSHHDTRPGGAWSDRGQEQNTGGIWAPVFLRFSDETAITALRVENTPVSPRAEREDGESWSAHATLTLESRSNRSIVVEARIVPDNFLAQSFSGGEVRKTFTLKAGSNTLDWQVPVGNVQLWWSWDHGPQRLYKMTVRVLDGTRELDRQETVLGFRTITVSAKSQEWTLNGRRVFVRGTNYISTQWLSEMNTERYAFDLVLMKRANINAVRVHAHIEGRDFYEQADRAGILIWQDFPLQWGYTEDPAFESEAVRQARDMVSVLYNYPSVAVWSLHNEPPWDASWMKYKYQTYNPKQNRRLDEMLFKAVSAADSSRYTHLASETLEHPWLGWYSGKWEDYGKPAPHPLITEFGAQALPDLASLRKIVGDDNLWPQSEAEWKEWEFHNFQKHETFDLAHVEKGASIEEFIDNTQAYQSLLTRFAAESYRRQRYQPVAAIFQFMFVEDWPSMNWGVVDYWRNPKPGYAALAQAYQPVLPSIAWNRLTWKEGEDLSLDLWAINDLPTTFPASRLECELRSGGKVAARLTVSLDLQADSGGKVAVLSHPKLVSGDYEVTARILDANDNVLGRNHFQFKVRQ